MIRIAAMALIAFATWRVLDAHGGHMASLSGWQIGLASFGALSFAVAAVVRIPARERQHPPAEWFDP